MESAIALPELMTERVRLRPLAGADVPALHRFWTDPAVRKYLWDNVIIAREQVEQIVGESEACFLEFGSGLFAIEVLGEPGRLVGFCGHRRMADGDDSDAMELLYGILPAYWGEGFVTEAAREVLRHGFEQCGFARVAGITDTPNQRSVRVMQRIGMVFQERRQYQGLDTVFFSISAEDCVARQ